MLEFDFNEPLNEEPDGTYITIGQMQFFLNRPDGKDKFKTGHEDFLDYYNLCRIYNLMSDMMKKDPDSAIMYWDDKQEIISIGFPHDGKVAKALAKIEESVMTQFDEDDDDEFGVFSDKPWNDG